MNKNFLANYRDFNKNTLELAEATPYMGWTRGPLLSYIVRWHAWGEEIAK